MSFLPNIKTYYALGLDNVARVGIYRLALRMGIHPVQKLSAHKPNALFFNGVDLKLSTKLIARNSWLDGSIQYFGDDLSDKNLELAPPDWFTAPLSDNRANSQLPWWEIPDFDPAIGDVKNYWELSRFDWVIPFAQHAALGHKDGLNLLNNWIKDWTSRNQPYLGVNWKCGQEASIRVMHLIAAVIIMRQHQKPTSGLLDLIEVLLRRIAPTIGYAIGQANNHGTSEAAALFVGGALLSGRQGNIWCDLGRKWLENRAKNLVEADGSFSQYSANYHRLMLDSYCLAETFRNQMGLPAFSSELGDKMAAATTWLEQLTDPQNGDVPNWGANDGAHIINLTNSGYRDYRPSVQLASSLFRNSIAYPPGPWDQQLYWLAVEPPVERAPQLTSRSFDYGGPHVLRAGKAVAYLHHPSFRFRPSQADVLHCDFWVNGENILRDAGTFSYNSTDDEMNYFKSTAAHNTVEFDNRDQMPQLSRFLFGDWLKTLNVEPVNCDNDNVYAASAYRDKWGAFHQRQLSLNPEVLKITDNIADFKSKAVLRWRLCSREWIVHENTISAGDLRIAISASMPICSINLVSGHESKYYQKKNAVPVLEVEFDEPGTVTTEIWFK